MKYPLACQRAFSLNASASIFVLTFHFVIFVLSIVALFAINNCNTKSNAMIFDAVILCEHFILWFQFYSIVYSKNCNLLHSIPFAL